MPFVEVARASSGPGTAQHPQHSQQEAECDSVWPSRQCRQPSIIHINHEGSRRGGAAAPGTAILGHLPLSHASQGRTQTHQRHQWGWQCDHTAGRPGHRVWADEAGRPGGGDQRRQQQDQERQLASTARCATWQHTQHHDRHRQGPAAPAVCGAGAGGTANRRLPGRRDARRRQLEQQWFELPGCGRLGCWQ